MATAPPLQRRRRHADTTYYPSSDGKPMGETDKHVNAMFCLLHMLRKRFAQQPDVYIAGNNFLYYQEGDPRKVVSPDGYVVFGVSGEMRDTYLVWREGYQLPAVVFELTSRKTKKQDLSVKYALYEKVLCIPEYFLFDPTGDYLRLNPLRGFRLENGVYRPIVPQNGKLHSEQLDVDLQAEGTLLRVLNSRTGEAYRTPQEDALYADEQRREAEAQHFEVEAQQRNAAEQRLRAQENEHRAMEQAQRADEQVRLTAEQAARAERAEAELARMRAELEALRQQRSSS